MSSPSDHFECHWQASRLLLAFYLTALVLALLTLLLIDTSPWLRGAGMVVCLLHAAWALPRQVLLSHEAAFSGLCRDEHGWQLFSRRGGWQPVQLRPSSLALPWVIVLHFRLAGERRSRSLCIPRDALAHDVHRRLRVRLKFSRRRWAAPG